MIHEESNRLLARNTIFLYIRMLVMMLISLYTSRLVLNVLGISDYGIYNVVGGVVVLFSFLNGTLATSSQRFLTYEIGSGNITKLKSIFNVSVHIHILLSLLVFCLGETIGLWFVNTQMIFPLERSFAVNCIYQFSIITCIAQTLIIPFNADVIAHERMNMFAYLSIFDVVLKLLLVIGLSYSACDKLILYAALMFFISLISLLIYMFYCKIQFAETCFFHKIDKQLLKEMSVFAGWNVFSDIAFLINTQGVNILLNVYFGPIVNAARGVGTQVLSAIHGFIYNFQTAAVPQITKSYAADETERLHKLIIITSKVSFFLLILIVTPLLLETKEILTLWLKILPDYTIVFVRLILLTKLAEVMAGTLTHAIRATGNIKKFQVTITTISLFSALISFIMVINGGQPELVYIVALVFAILAQIYRVYFVLPRVGLDYSIYIKDVICRSFIVFIISFTLSFVTYSYIHEGLMRLLMICFINFASILISVYFIGLNFQEKQIITEIAKNRIRKQ